MKKPIFIAALTIMLSAASCCFSYAEETTGTAAEVSKTAAADTTSEAAKIAANANKRILLKIGQRNLIVNGETVILDVPPVLVVDRTLVPLRGIIEALDGTVDWDENEKKVTLGNGTSVIELTIDSNIAYLNGVEVQLDTKPVIMNDRAMFPLRFIAEAFGYIVDYGNPIVISAQSKFYPMPWESMYEGEDGNLYHYAYDKMIITDNEHNIIAKYGYPDMDEYVYADDSGNKLTYNSGSRAYIKPDGTMITFNDSEDLAYQIGSDGNIYKYGTLYDENIPYAHGIYLETPDGEITERYYHYICDKCIYTDIYGRENAIILDPDASAFEYPDGKVVKFIKERKDEPKFIGTYNNSDYYYDHTDLVRYENGTPAESMQKSGYYKLYVSENGDEYKYCYKDNKKIFVFPNGDRVTLEHNNVSAILPDNKGTVYFEFSEETGGGYYWIDITDADKNVIEHLKYGGFIDAFKNENGDIYKLHNYGGHLTLIMPNGDKIEE